MQVRESRSVCVPAKNEEAVLFPWERRHAVPRAWAGQLAL